LTSLVNKFHIWTFLRNSILIGFVLFQFSCSEKSEVDISNTIQFEGKIYEIESETPFSGIVYNNYSNGQREYEGSYKNGTPNGSLIYWYENGVTMREGMLENGTPIGRWTYYNPDGSIQKTTDH